jgi:RNA polymerase sigma-70 factor (ECF subfamily)
LRRNHIRGESRLANQNFSDLVKKARKGDASAFASLYKNIYKDLYRIAYLNLNSEEDAADAVSDAVLDAFASLKSLKDENAFRSWFLSILFAKIKKTQRGYVKTRENILSDDDYGDYDNYRSSGSSDFGFSSLEVKTAFSKLSEEEREILSLSAVFGYTSDEIAKSLGISANTVRSKAARARDKLKKYLA